MEEEIKKMLCEKIKLSKQGLTNGEILLAIYLLANEKGENKEPEVIEIGKKITVKGSGGIGTRILLDDKYSIEGIYDFEPVINKKNGTKVILEFFPHEIEMKINGEEAIF